MKASTTVALALSTAPLVLHLFHVVSLPWWLIALPLALWSAAWILGGLTAVATLRLTRQVEAESASERLARASLVSDRQSLAASHSRSRDRDIALVDR